MTSKKNRQRGGRTHGGGSQKNRRGAGHRGGRGRAGRSKHEFHNYPSKRKSGFKRPDQVQDDVAEVDVQTLDEDAALLAAEGLAEAENGGYRLDVREVVEDDEVDFVKLLGNGQVRTELHLLTDAVSDGAREKVEAAGGSVELTATGEALVAETDKDTNDDSNDN